MIGPLELLIVALVIFLLFGGYKMLPKLGRSAGRGVREGGVKAKELAATVSSKAEQIDTDKIARSAGDGIREARELREAVTGKGSAKKPESAAADEPAEPSPREGAGAREVADDPSGESAGTAGSGEKSS